MTVRRMIQHTSLQAATVLHLQLAQRSRHGEASSSSRLQPGARVSSPGRVRPEAVRHMEDTEAEDRADNRAAVDSEPLLLLNLCIPPPIFSQFRALFAVNFESRWPGIELFICPARPNHHNYCMI